MNSNSGKNIK